MGYMKNPSLVIANRDSANIFICKGSVDEFDKLLSLIAGELIVHMSVTTMTII